MAKAQLILRVLAVSLLVFTASLVGFSTETKEVLLVRKKATFRDLNSLYVSVYVYSVAAGYNLLRLCNLSAWFERNSKWTNVGLVWAGLLLDQLAIYFTFGANTAALQASILAVTGQNEFQWMKLCNRFTRFCIQIGGAMICGYIACIVMILVTSFSAFNLFRLYSPKRFLLLKVI
ncbi:Casparian strip membrane protein [Parasponia andersonii]|uniref:CASP-like protein n=1 Tax=Parasponia andersonii TaxID=3476 RepID=A0A2P5C778_PARAD|nr:Casparian strip membrane protein [Parasponia andersonii]